MIAPLSHTRPVVPAVGQRLGHAMNVILHIGAHRCATTSFQHYLRHNSQRLQTSGIGFWGPRRTRNGLFSGVLPGPVVIGGGDPARRAAGRIGLACARSRNAGLHTLIVSDENTMGSVRENLRLGSLYCGVGERIARFADAFDGRITDVVLNIRSQDHYWSSALGYSLMRGMSFPKKRLLARLAGSARGWRDVITDIACAAGSARVWVFPFEAFCGQPETQLAMMTGARPPTGEARAWLNRTPDLDTLREQLDPDAAKALPGGSGRWVPFAPDEAAALREAYADDILWLAAGAGGAASLMNNQTKLRHGRTGPGRDMTRGRTDDQQDRRVAHAR